MSLDKQRVHPPPSPSTPREAPWAEIEALVDGLQAVAAKLDQVILALRGMPFPAAPLPAAPPPTRISVNGRLDALIERLDALLRAPPGVAGALDGRFDALVKYTKNRDKWEHSHTDVATPGGAVQLGPLAIPDGFDLVVRARPGNTGDIYVGKTKGDASRSAVRITLVAGEAINLRVTNASLVWIDAVVSGEGVEYFVEQD